MLEGCYCGRATSKTASRPSRATLDGLRGAPIAPIADIWNAWTGSPRKPGDTPSRRRRAVTWRCRRRCTIATRTEQTKGTSR